MKYDLLAGSDRGDRKYNLSFTYCIINFINTYKYIYIFETQC